MLKLMNSVIIFVILCGGIQSINREALQCKFQDFGFTWGSMYTCHVSSLDNSKNDKVINSYTGTHLANKYDNDVKAIRIYGTNTKYIPEGLGSLFNLLGLLIHSSQLIEIRSKDFQGMQNLEYLSLSFNKLTSVPSDAFSTLPKLKYIYLSSNQIKYIGSGAFDQLTNLNRVYLVKNICVNKDYKESTEINQMKLDIKLTCDKANDIIQYEITNEFKELITGIQKDALMNQEELKKLINKLFKASEEHQENLKLRTELSLAKDEQKTAQDTNDQLKKELTEAKETIDQKLPKMEQTIEDFYMEVMDLKIERHNERQNSIALRTKLMEANECTLYSNETQMIFGTSCSC